MGCFLDCREFRRFGALRLSQRTETVSDGGNYDPGKFSPEVLAAIQRGISDGHKAIIDAAAEAKDSRPFYGTREFMGPRYLDLATGVEAGGIIPNVPKQAYYGQWTKDADGDPLDGSKHNYTFTFPKGQLPPVRFFWSVGDHVRSQHAAAGRKSDQPLLHWRPH